MLRRGTCLVLLLLVAGCSGSRSTPRVVFRLSLVGLPPLAADSVYEGWAVVGGIAASTGKFILNANAVPPLVTSPDGIRIYGNTSEATFGPSATGLGEDFPLIREATHFFITIETRSGFTQTPSGNVIMAGPIVDETAVLSTTGVMGPTGATGLPDFSTASGSVLLTNATGMAAPESGVWFSTSPVAPGMPSLSLPELVDGQWRYEAFIQDFQQFVSLGTFRSVDRYDFDAQSNPTRGTQSIGLNVPGQDFHVAATRHAATPLNLATGDWVAVITLEPVPDNDEAPFPLPLLSAIIPPDAVSAQGLSSRDVTMNTHLVDLPMLMVAATPAEISFTGNGPPSLIAPTAGLYGLQLRIGGMLTSPILFQVDGAGQVLDEQGTTVFGDVTSFVMNDVNTGLLGAFPDATAASEVCISLQPQGLTVDDGSTPTLLSGFLLGGQGVLTTDAIADFTGISGTFSTSTPTNNVAGGAPDDQMGIWWRGFATGTPSLVLPTPAAGWRYEGWVRNTFTGETYSTGTFSSVMDADDDARLFDGQGPLEGFPVPGQDFVESNAGINIQAMPNLISTNVIVSLEPYPDDSREPYLPILSGVTPGTVNMSGAPMNQTGALPSGVLTFER